MRPILSRSPHVFGLSGRLRKISQLIYADMMDRERGPLLRTLAGHIVQACPVRGDVGQKDADFCELWTTYEWIVSNVRYSGDIGEGKHHEALDLYQSPIASIRMGIGDCDDHVGVCVALLRMMGWRVKAAVSSHTGSAWEHIYAVVTEFPKVAPYRDLPFDTTLGHGKLGQEADYRKRILVEI